MRVRQREQAYSIIQLKEYLPEYDNRMIYVENRTASELRRSLYQIITETKNFIYRRDFPIDHCRAGPGRRTGRRQGDRKAQSPAQDPGSPGETQESPRPRARKRWQAHYDLMLAQTVAFQVKAFEYRALMAQIIQNPPVPSKLPTPDLAITWVVDHASEPLAAKNLTAKKYAEAKRLLEDVIAKHPKTPWADLAQDTLDRGFSVKLNEWHHNPKYAERAQFVPKY